MSDLECDHKWLVQRNQTWTPSKDSYWIRTDSFLKVCSKCEANKPYEGHIIDPESGVEFINNE